MPLPVQVGYGLWVFGPYWIRSDRPREYYGYLSNKLVRQGTTLAQLADKLEDLRCGLDEKEEW